MKTEHNFSNSDACEQIMRVGRLDNAQICGRVPMEICAGCDTVLCVVHSDKCPDCKAWLCEGCLYLHEEMHKEVKDVLEVLDKEITRLRAEVAAYKSPVTE